ADQKSAPEGGPVVGHPFYDLDSAPKLLWLVIEAHHTCPIHRLRLTLGSARYGGDRHRGADSAGVALGYTFSLLRRRLAPHGIDLLTIGSNRWGYTEYVSKLEALLGTRPRHRRPARAASVETFATCTFGSYS